MGINLSKGQRIELTKTNPGLKKVYMGLGWDPVQTKSGWFSSAKSANVDLDASCIMFDENANVVDTVWWRQLGSKDGSVKHGGDNQTGQGAGDDERIYVDLTKVAANVKALIFTINSYRGQTFNEIEEASARLVDEANNVEIAKLVITGAGNHTAAIMASVYRNGSEWKMASISEIGDGPVVAALVELSKKYV